MAFLIFNFADGGRGIAYAFRQLVASEIERFSFEPQPVTKRLLVHSLFLTGNVTLFVTLFVTNPKEQFATFEAQRPIRVSEIIITSLTRIGGTMKRTFLVTGLALLLLATLAGVAYAATGVTDPAVLKD